MAILLILGLILAHTASGQNISGQAVLLKVSNYNVIGSKYSTVPAKPNQVRNDSDYNLRNRVIDFILNIYDSLQGGSAAGTLNQVLLNGNTSYNKVFLGKPTGLNAYQQIEFGIAGIAAGGDSSGYFRIKDTNATTTIFGTTTGGVANVTVTGPAGRQSVLANSGITTSHLNGNGTTPTALSFGGTGLPGVSLTVSGSDLAGVITFTTGVTPTLDTLFRLSFANAYATPPTYATTGAANAAAADGFALGQVAYVPQDKMFTGVCYFMGAHAALDALTVYKVYYHFIK